MIIVAFHLQNVRSKLIIPISACIKATGCNPEKRRNVKECAGSQAIGMVMVRILLFLSNLQPAWVLTPATGRDNAS